MNKFLDQNGLARAWDNIKNYVDTAVSGIIGGGGATSENIPPGGIIIWSGSTVPDGWALCDGSNDTPDLRGRFVLGENDDHVIGETGGEEEVTLTVEQMPEHRHGYQKDVSTSSRLQSGSSTYNTVGSIITVNTTNTGSSKPHPNMPPYYVLAYIMKL